MAPKRSIACATRSWQADSSVMSAVMATAVAPSLVELVGGGLRPVAVDVGRHEWPAPSRVRHFDMPRPMPPPAPVTIAVLSLESHADLSYVL